MFSIKIGNLSGLFSTGGVTVATPSTNDNSYTISDNTIGCPICHLSILKKSLITVTHLRSTSFLLNPDFVRIAKLIAMFIIYASLILIASVTNLY